MSKVDLDALYRGGSPSAWEHEASVKRPDWDIARAAIRDRFKERFSILDVGCFDGAFLHFLRRDCTKCGIEISSGAADRAAARGIDILSRDYEALESKTFEFDVVTAFDVIEHVDNPSRFITLLARALRPGGLLVISTGDLDSYTWRLMKHRYWYSAFPEHISYLSQRWFSQIATRMVLRLISARRFAHATMPWGRRVTQAAANLAFLASPKAVRFLRDVFVGRRAGLGQPDNYPPSWMSASDHLIVILEKPLLGPAL